MNILNRIVEWKTSEIETLPDVSEKLPVCERDFFAALQGRGKVIGEIKPASPVKGRVLPKDFDVAEFATSYEKAGVSAISVLTDAHFFGGSFLNLQKAKSATTNVPILCKDFIISEKQIQCARKHGADSFLLIVKILSVDVLRLLIDTGRSYGMEPLVEIADEEDLQKVLQTDAKIIGINNRDLRDFSVDISRTFLLAKRIPSNRIVISLSGFFGPDVRLVKNVCNGVLVGSGIGSQLSTNHYQLSIQSALSRFISPNPLVKFCGVRTEADFDMAKKLETPLLGINFVPTSKRCISEEVAGVLSTKDPGNMRIVGVFQDQSRDSVQKMCSIYKLDFAQLSGDESPEEYADFSLPIIKGISMTDDDRHLSQMEKWDKTADVFLFDGKNPGSGESWVESSDLQTIRGKDFLQNLHKPYVIAGGICPENAKRICDYTSADGVDTASGIEDESGEWSLKKMIAILSSLGQKT